MAVTAGKIWIPEVGSSTHYHAQLCQPALGAHDGEDDEDRPAHLLPHLWRRLELSGSSAVPAGAISARIRAVAPPQIAGQYVALSLTS